MFDLAHISMYAGVMTILGAMFLIFKEKIYLDAQTKQVLSVELPFFGKLRTNAPTFAVIVLGFVAIIYPQYLNQTRYVTITQVIKSDAPVSLNAYAVADQTTVGDDKSLELSIPMLSNPAYHPHLILHSANIWHEISINKDKIHGNQLKLDDLSLQSNDKQPSIQPVTTEKPAGFQ